MGRVIEKFLKVIRVISDDLEAEERKRRIKLAIHIIGGLFGLVIGLGMMFIIKMDATSSLIAGAAGKSSIDFADFVERVLRSDSLNIVLLGR